MALSKDKCCCQNWYYRHRLLPVLKLVEEASTGAGMQAESIARADTAARGY